MSITRILNTFLDRTADIKRATKTLTAQGSTSSALSTIITGIGATVQPVRMDELKNLPQGNNFRITDKAYINYDDQGLEIKPGDTFHDNMSSKDYIIVSVQRFKSARASVTTGHHTKLYLEDPQAPRS